MEIPSHPEYCTQMVLEDAEVAERVRSFSSLPVDHPERFDEAGELVPPAKPAKSK